MKKIWMPLIAVVLVTSCKSNKASTGNSGSDGWTVLFDGKSTNGWHTYGQTGTGAAWQVTDGTLHMDPAAKKQPNDGGDIVTNAEYGNFDLKLEWKIAPAGNSGVLFYVHEDPAKYKATYWTGPEMQVLDNGHPDYKIIKHRAGDLYDLISSVKEMQKPAGEWNEAEIISNNGKLEFYLNGVRTVSTTMWDESWKKMVGGSKFTQWPDFGTFTKGHIALQDHGNDVWYRNIRIKEL